MTVISPLQPKQWPPNYVKQYVVRHDRYKAMVDKPELIIGAKEYYSDPANWAEFVEHWMITYDPRNSKNKDLPATLPFVFFPRQREFFDFLISCWQDGESGLVEKCRDMGATWECCSFSVCMWLFSEGSAVGFGSRKEQLVDKIGDPDSIFQKIRMLLDGIPSFFLPEGYNSKVHCSYMKVINPQNGSTITGEAGDNIGRGGRKSIYFKDESAHYERPELIEAALGDNTDCQIDISSVNGTANVFARRRKNGIVWDGKTIIEPGVTRVFVFDWRDHPLKTQEWYDKRRNKAEREGLLHIFAQEVDRDYAAAVEGILIPAQWVQAAVDLEKRFPMLAGMRNGKILSALDVADEGGDLNSQADRQGITLIGLDKWAEGDTGQTADKAVMRCRMINAEELQYDCIGVGAGVKAETNRLQRLNKLPVRLKVIPWNAGGALINPNGHSIPGDIESPLNKNLYGNLKAQGWWNLRIRFEKTWRYVNKGVHYPVSELINIPSDTPYFHDLLSELSQPTYGQNGSGQIIVNKKPDGTRSPNLADSVNMVFWPWSATKNIGVWGSK